LDTRWFLPFGLPTIAVLNANSCNAGDIEEDEIDRRGRPCTAFAIVMTKLMHNAKIRKLDPGEKFARPFLEVCVLEGGE